MLNGWSCGLHSLLVLQSSEKHQHDDENEEDDSVLAMECYSFPDKASSFDNVLGRRLFYSHHILSPIKRDLILSLVSQSDRSMVVEESSLLDQVGCGVKAWRIFKNR